MNLNFNETGMETNSSKFIRLWLLRMRLNFLSISYHTT